MTTRRYQASSIPALPVSTDPALRQFLSAIKETLEVRLRQRGNALDAAPTFRDLIDAGLLNIKDGVSIGGRNYTSNELIGLLEFTLPSWITSDTAPSPPTGLTVSAKSTAVSLAWTASLSDNYGSTEVWRASSNNLTLAVQIGSTSGSTYVDSLPDANAVYYYWIRHVSRSGVVSPFNDVNGAPTAAGSAAPVVSYSFQGPDVVFSWPTPTSNLVIQYYTVEVFTGATWSQVDVVGGNLYRRRVDWLGSKQFRVRGVDVQGNVGAAGTTTAIVAAPSAPTPTVSYDGLDVLIKWSATTTGSLPIASYRVYQNSVSSGNLLSDQLSTTFRQKVLWSSKTFYVSIVDTAGNEGAAVSAVSTVTPPAQPSITSAFDGEFVRLTLASTPNSLPIDGFDLRFGTSFATGTVVATLAGSSHSVRADWLGSRTFWAVATDTADNDSTPGSTAVTVSAPPATTVTGTVVAGAYELSWSAVAGSLPVSHYEIRRGATWATATFVARASGTRSTVKIDWAGSQTFLVAGVDTVGNVGTAGSHVATITLASTPVVSAVFDGEYTRLSWASTPGSLPIDSYVVRFGAAYATGTAVTTTSATGVSVRSDWLGARTFWVAAVDSSGNVSTAGSAVSTVSAPPAPTVAGAIVSNALELSWGAVAGSLPISHYEVRRGAVWATATFVAIASGTKSSVKVDWTGNQTFLVAGVDTIGNVGAAGSYLATITVASTPTVSAAVDGESIRITWTSTAGSLPIDYFIVRFGASYAAGTAVTTVSGTSTLVLADWTGARTFWVAAVDTSGNVSTAGSAVATINLPPAVAPTNAFSGVTSVISWPAVAGTLATAAYELRYGASYATGTYVARSSGTSIAVPVEWVGSRTYWVAAIDVRGNTGTAGSTNVVVSVPSAPTVTSEFSGFNSIINWTEPASSLTIEEYELRYGSTWAGGTSLGRVKGTTFSLRANWSGARTFWVSAYDLNGNIGAQGSTSVTVTAPPAPNVRLDVIDNNVLLYWTQAQSTLPIETTEIRKGASWATGQVIGSKTGAFTTIFESVQGTYTYWVASIDTAGNYGAASSQTASVSQPPDYLLATNYTTTFTGTKSNAFVDTETGSLILPVDTSQTWTTHFTAKSWTTPQNQIDAGYPYFIQPGFLTGYYEETFDYGATLAAMKVSVTYLLTTLVGSVAVVPTITVASDAGFTSNVQTVSGDGLYAVNFRYIKVRITATATNDQGVAQISNLSVRLDAKLKNDSGTATMSVGGAHPQANLTQDYLSSWAVQYPLSTPPSGFNLNGGASENKITLGAGPSGNNELLWACVDADVGNDADGGWNGSTVTADCTTGHLYAVFMKTTTNNGSSYWGCSTNGSVANIPTGTANTNPYFWNGDLPALNTWYLVVGYVHPIGYGTTVTTHSGIYNLAGTKLVSGTDYKYSAGANNIAHRAYHYYNVTNSTNEVQYMCRPVVIACSTADITSKVNYLLTCATNWGATVPLATSFIDLTAITVASNGTSAATVPIYDFYDAPYPKRFNVFNFTTAGVLTSGQVGWAVRGY